MTQCSVPRGNALCRGATLYAVGRHSVPWGDDAPQLRQRSGLGDRSLLPPPLPPPHVCPPCPPLPPRRQLQRSLPADAAAGGTDGALGDTCLGFILAPNLHYFTRQPGTYQRHPHGTQWGGKKPPQNPTATNPPPASRALRRAASALPHLRAAKGDLSDGNQIPRSPPAAAPLPPRSDRRSAASRPRANGCSALPTRCHSSRSALQTVLFFVCKGLRSGSPSPPSPVPDEYGDPDVLAVGVHPAPCLLNNLLLRVGDLLTSLPPLDLHFTLDFLHGELRALRREPGGDVRESGEVCAQQLRPRSWNFGYLLQLGSPHGCSSSRSAWMRAAD